MTPRSLRRVVLALVVAASAWSGVADAKPLLEQKPTAVIELSNDSATQRVAIAITTVDGVTLTDASVSNVALGDRPMPSLNTSFTASVTETRGKLVMTATLAPLWRSGTYHVDVDVAGTTGPSPAQVTETVRIPFVLPAATLRPVAPLVINDVRWNPLGSADVQHPLTLRETGKVSAITRLTVVQDDPGDGRLVAQGLSDKDADRRIAAAGSRVVVLDGTGFATGTTTGTLTVDGDQLAQPLSIPFKVNAKIHAVWIVIVFLIFGLFGWLARVVLKNAEQTAMQREQLAGMYKQARHLIDNHPDLEKGRALQKKLDAADAALGKKDAQTAIDALAAELKEALDTFNKAIAEMYRAVDTLRPLVEREWDLPPDFDVTRTTLVRIEAELVGDHLKRAKDEMQRIHKTLDLVGEAGNAWRTRTVDSMKVATTALSGEKNRAPSSVRADVEDQLVAARTAVEAVPDYQPKKPPGPVDDLAKLGYLDKLDAARRAVRALDDTLRRGIATAVGEFIEAWGRRGKPPEEVEPLRAATTLDDKPEDPTTRLDAAIEALSRLDTEVSKLIKSSGTKSLAPDDEVLELARSTRSRPPAPLLLRPTVVVRPAAATAVDPVKLAAHNLSAIRFVQSLFTAALLSVLALVVYRDSWMGTFNDFVAVALFAFFTDFTLDAALEALAKLRKAPAPASPT